MILSNPFKKLFGDYRKLQSTILHVLVVRGSWQSYIVRSMTQRPD